MEIVGSNKIKTNELWKIFIVKYKTHTKIFCLSLTMIITIALLGGCGNKPSEAEMKDIITTVIFSLHNEFIKPKSITFDNFKINNEFNKTIDGESWYLIEVDYKVTCVYYITDNPDKDITQTREGKDERWSFIKRGSKLYGRPGW